jgi:hypothetical protein
MPAQKLLTPVPVRSAVLGQGGMVSTPWVLFFNALRAAAATFPVDTPAPSTTPSDLSVPIEINGAVYYLRLSSTP